MQYVADLHVHSKYSRAVSRDMVLPIMARVAAQKGIDILSVSDWTHGLWFKEIGNQLEEKGEGLYKLKAFDSSSGREFESGQLKDTKETMFILSAEISSIYSQGGKLRRIHNLIFAPSLQVAEKVNKELARRGCNLMSDGRPIIGLSSKALLELLLSIDDKTMLIPCHAWTPHFGIYGSASGFDSIEESFGDLSPYIYGVETGLSSDPEMNWEIKELMDRAIISTSDAHSPAKMGREATVFTVQNSKFKVQNDSSKFKITYEDILAAIKRDPAGNLKIGYTIEFYPEEGKYHYSGHRNCQVVRGPEETRKEGNICPVCKKRLTEGVSYRVQQLADEKLLNRVIEKISPNGIKWYTDSMRKQPPYVKLVPLLEIIAESMKSTVSSNKVKISFDALCKEFGSEIEVLLKTPTEDIERIAGPRISEGIAKVRKGDIVVDPGYDGEYGKVKIWGVQKTASNAADAKGTEGQRDGGNKGSCEAGSRSAGEKEDKSQLGLF